MKQYFYNGVELPALPTVTDYPYALIGTLDDSDGTLGYDYVLLYESDPFKVFSSQLTFLIDSSYLVYMCNANDASWASGSLTIEETDENAAYAKVDSRASYLWTNKDILDGDTGAVAYSGSDVVINVIADAPTWTTQSDDIHYGGTKTYDIGASVNWSVGATATDVGVLEYVWYQDDVPVANGTTYTVPTDKNSVHAYYCVVTNTLNDTSASTTSNKVIISVVARNVGLEINSFLLGWLAGRRIRKLPIGLVCCGNADDLSWSFDTTTLELSVTANNSMANNATYSLIGDTLNVTTISTDSNTNEGSSSENDSTEDDTTDDGTTESDNDTGSSEDSSEDGESADSDSTEDSEGSDDTTTGEGREDELPLTPIG